MDFDLFEQDDDDELLSSVQLEPTQQLADQPFISYAMPEFQCNGEDSHNAKFSNEGFIKNAFLNYEQVKSNAMADEITLTGYEFRSKRLLARSVTKFVFGEACVNIQYLAASVNAPVGHMTQLSYYYRRRQVTQLLHMLLYTTHYDQWDNLREQLTKVRRLLNRITEPIALKAIYFANNPKGNDCNVPAYHLLHGVLEWKLLDVCILQKFETKSMRSENKLNSTFAMQLQGLFDNLITCSLYIFAKKKHIELLNSSPFPCTCFKELWLILQLAIQKWFADMEITGDGKMTFWVFFNNAMARVKTKMESWSLTPLNYAVFSNWMLHALTMLFGYRSNGDYEGPKYTRANSEEAENYEFCENCVQQFLNENPKEEQLRAYLGLLTPILLQWWRPRVNIVMQLWEYLHKRLNSAFYITGSAPGNLAVTCPSGRAYLEKYRALLEKPQADANQSSYTHFVLLLGKTLERLLKTQQDHLAQKLLGRIYSKFTIQKFLALNETGIHHIIELFLVMALSGDFNDLAPKLRDKLLCIALDKITPHKQLTVARGHMALLTLFAEQRQDFSEYVSKLFQQLANVRQELDISKIFADALLDIFSEADDFRRGEHLLIDAWLPNFLNNCTPVEQERCLEALHLIFVKLQRREHFVVDTHSDLYKPLNAFVLPFLKQQYVTNFSPWLPQLAADFCIHSSTVADTQSFQKLFSFFAEANTANRQALPRFLLNVLESDRSALVDSSTIMHVWLKSLVLLTAQNETVYMLTRRIAYMPQFKQMTDLDAQEVLNAKEPLCVFVAAVGKRYNSCTDYQERCKIADTFNAYLRNFEKWLQSDMKLEKTELSFRFYSFLAIVIYNCPHIVYTKSKITCFFHIAITRFILPTSIQMGKHPDSKLAQLIHKIWPVLVQGIGHLNYKSDPYMQKTLTDLIQKWTPNFKISPNTKIVARPFITCIQGDNTELSLFVLEKLTSLFLATQRRQADPNACLVVTIFQEIIDAIAAAPKDEANVQRLQTYIKATCLPTLEHIMMVDEVVPSRGMLLECYKHLISSAVYQGSSELQEMLAENLRVLTKKHLAYYTFFYFELLMKLTQISHQLMEKIMDTLLVEVRIVEQKRGVGVDNRIRSCLRKLQQAIELAKRKLS